MNWVSPELRRLFIAVTQVLSETGSTRVLESMLFMGSALGPWGHPRRGGPESDSSHRYEEEINKRTAAENDFVVLKKVKDPFPHLLPQSPARQSGLKVEGR